MERNRIAQFNHFINSNSTVIWLNSIFSGSDGDKYYAMSQLQYKKPMLVWLSNQQVRHKEQAIPLVKKSIFYT